MFVVFSHDGETVLGDQILVLVGQAGESCECENLAAGVKVIEMQV